MTFDFINLKAHKQIFHLFVCRKKMPLKEVGNLKAKKSPSGWRSIFSKGNRQSSIKHKNHKSGLSRKKDPLDFIRDLYLLLNRFNIVFFKIFKIHTP